ncbi:hypothetical protein COTS27_01126 [Spirochaetota bacterium]|nr:hypothetical protein COTS27_01126 [Spirochaetota bacterium]
MGVMNFQKILTLSGWGLSKAIYDRLPWEQKNIAWEHWLYLNPLEREVLFKKTLDEAEKPMCFMGLSLGGFLAHDIVVRNSGHKNLAGAVFFALAESFVKTPLVSLKTRTGLRTTTVPSEQISSTYPLPSPLINPYGNNSNPLQAMLRTLSAAKHTIKSLKNDNVIKPMLTNFITAGLSKSEQQALTEADLSQLQLDIPKQPRDSTNKANNREFEKITEALMSGLKFLMQVQVTLPALLLKEEHPNKKNPGTRNDNARLNPLEKPFLVFQGNADAILDHRGAELFAKKAGYSYHAIRGGGHFIPFTQPEIVVKTLKNC